MQSMPSCSLPKNPHPCWNHGAALRTQPGVLHPPRTAEGQGLLPQHLLGQKMCPWRDFIPQCPKRKGQGAHGLRKLLWQPVGRSPPRKRQGSNLTGLQESGELGEPGVGCERREGGRGREGRAGSLSPASAPLGCRRRAFLPHPCPGLQFLLCLQSQVVGGGREQEKAAVMRKQKGVRLKNEEG